MGKTKELSEFIKNEIIIKYNSGISLQNIIDLYKIPRATVYYHINKYKKHTQPITLRVVADHVKQLKRTMVIFYRSLSRIFYKLPDRLPKN